MEHAGFVLVGLKNTIIFVVSEINALKHLNNVMHDQLPIYLNAMETLNNSIDKLHNVYINDVPIEHTLKFAFLNNLNLKLVEFSSLLQRLKTIKKSSNCCSKLAYILCNPPSKLIIKVENMFETVNKIIVETIKLEETIFGSAIRILHPKLQLAWMLVGLNQLNDISIDANVLIQSLLILLKKEEKNIDEIQEQYYIRLITSFVNHIDNIGGTSMDSRISIFELNNIKPTDDNIGSVKQMIEKEYDNIISHKNEIKHKSNKFIKSSLNTLIRLHSMNHKLNRNLSTRYIDDSQDESETKDNIDSTVLIKNSDTPKFYSNNLYIQNVKICDGRYDDTIDQCNLDKNKNKNKKKVITLETIKEEENDILPQIDNISNNSNKSNKSNNSNKSNRSNKSNKSNKLNSSIKKDFDNKFSDGHLPLLVNNTNHYSDYVLNVPMSNRNH